MVTLVLWSYRLKSEDVSNEHPTQNHIGHSYDTLIGGARMVAEPAKNAPSG
jgi:hypothetical protein